MKSHSLKQLIFLVLFGALVYVIDVVIKPRFGMGVCSILSAVLLVVLLVGTKLFGSRETDERERQLSLHADSFALQVVIISLLGISIFFPDSDYAMAFWGIFVLTTLVRSITFIYQRYR
jgi:nitrate reductase gamma subunit